MTSNSIQCFECNYKQYMWEAYCSTAEIAE